ncbi:MAG: tetratricopeptide repeat protein [Cyclobacteriaceae bacterium]|nr:tetratricopeptide repeat protein [Cyclobacteriaceae bacterium]QOI96719.1 MAG: tetratricopeptide repeat protein [Flammeovirgaceae bacterium]
MLKNRIILVVISAALIAALFMLPKAVVRNDEQTIQSDSSGQPTATDPHQVPQQLKQTIVQVRRAYQTSTAEKNAIFADSLAALYSKAGRFDSAAWFAEKAATFFNTLESWAKAGNAYYEAYTFATDESRQGELAQKAQEYFAKVLAAQPANLDVKSKLAMTYMSSANPMQGITLLREVLAADPKNETALFNLGMLSIQSGQYDRAIERLTELTVVNPNHVQGLLLLGVAYMNTGDRRKAREQFEKVKQLDTDPAVQATADSYLNDLK